MAYTVWRVLVNKTKNLAHGGELGGIQRLGKHVRRVVLAANPFYRHSPILNVLAEEMVTDVDMFSALMKLRVLGQLYSGLIIHVNRDSAKVEADAKVVNECLKLESFFNSLF